MHSIYAINYFLVLPLYSTVYSYIVASLHYTVFLRSTNLIIWFVYFWQLTHTPSSSWQCLLHHFSSHPSVIINMTSSASTSSGLSRTRRMSWLQSYLLHFSDHFTSSNNNTVTTTCNSFEDPSGAGYRAICTTSTISRFTPAPSRPNISSVTTVSNTFPVKNKSFWNRLQHLQVMPLILYTPCVFGYLLVGVLVWSARRGEAQCRLCATQSSVHKWLRKLH